MNDIEKEYRKSIGNKIKLARSKTKYTQEQLAEKLSLSARYISQLERGIAFGSVTTIVNLCKVLHTNPDFLFSDILESDYPNSNQRINTKFLENYFQLDNRNQEIINIMTKQLLKMQKETEL